MGSQEFHDLANVTQAMIWKGVAAVTRARIDIAQTRLLREETRDLRLRAQEARTAARPTRCERPTPRSAPCSRQSGSRGWRLDHASPRNGSRLACRRG